MFGVVPSIRCLKIPRGRGKDVVERDESAQRGD